MSNVVFERGKAERDAPVAFVTARTPCEQAWADLCDERDNPDTERTMALIGGWDAWGETPLTWTAFMAAFNGDPEPAARLRGDAA